MPWTWVNHWIVMITYLHHTSPDVPKYTSESWTFIRGATATIDRDFSFIGSDFFHHISSDHVAHHLVSKMPRYYSPVASKAIVPLLGKHCHGRGTFKYEDLKVAFGKCQWVEQDKDRDASFGLKREEVGEGGKKNEALWYRAGVSPAPEYKQRDAAVLPQPGNAEEPVTLAAKA